MILLSFIEKGKILPHLEMLKILTAEYVSLKKKLLLLHSCYMTVNLRRSVHETIFCIVLRVDDLRPFFLPLCAFSPSLDRGVQLKCLRCSHMQQDFPGKNRVSLRYLGANLFGFPPNG